MVVEFPPIDYIMHANLDKMSYLQKEYVNLLNLNIHFTNSTFLEILDRVSREFNPISIVNLLQMVNKTLATERDGCNSVIRFDDFVKNASLVSQALKKIISSPSKKLVKLDKFVLASKVTRFDSKTMSWLSKRPGSSIEEKIAPKNLIPTKVTFFSTDTKENRHTMYLYDILYDYLYDKVYPNGAILECENCSNKNEKCYALYENLKSIMLLKHKKKTMDLHSVPKEKQLRQNNKLLSDKEYKQIWDAVSDIDYFEQNCKNIWVHLKQRYQFMVFLIVCATISQSDDVLVYDTLSQLHDDGGVLSVSDRFGINQVRFHSLSASKDMVVSLSGDSIQVDEVQYSPINPSRSVIKENRKAEIDLSHIFGYLSDIDEREKEYSRLIDSRNENYKQLSRLKAILDDLYAKHQTLEVLGYSLELLGKEIALHGKEEKEKRD